LIGLEPKRRMNPGGDDGGRHRENQALPMESQRNSMFCFRNHPRPAMPGSDSRDCHDAADICPAPSTVTDCAVCRTGADLLSEW
jgi:hypothetical protein